jgi:acetyl-CoA carboxylase carboxyltransferase component
MSTISQARKRINSLLDENSFVEIGAAVTARSTDFNLKQVKTPSDGVITGYGVINENPVYIYSQDASVLGGTIGEMHAKKIVNLYDLAIKTGTPVIGLLDSAGIRLEESVDALNGFGEIYQKQAVSSGVIPQITAIFGTCGGGLALFPTLTDFTFMESKNAKLFVNSPNALAGNHDKKNNTAGADFQAKEAGSVDVVADEATIYTEIRQLISLIPGHNEDEQLAECKDDLNRLLPDIAASALDPALSLRQISDDGTFFETKRGIAGEMVTGFIKLDGLTVGAIANRSVVYDAKGKEAEKYEAALSVAGCIKASDFIHFCDAFSIPVLSLTNVTGYHADVETERRIARAAGKLTYAFANATVPKVNVIVGKAFGSAYVAMNSKSLGCDMTFAWPNAEIGMMDAKTAAMIMCEGQGADATDKCAKEYAELQNSVNSAAARGYVDTIIEPADTRKYVVNAFEMLYSKQVEHPYKKHGTT